MKYITYKYYTNKGERLAIFYNESKKEIEVIKCNKKDTFNKKVAKTLYESNFYRYTTIKKECKNIKEFLEECNNLFNKYFYVSIPGKIQKCSLVYSTEDKSIIKILA